MLIENEFNLGDLVYLKTDPAQSQRLVTRLQVASTGIMYQLSCGTTDSWHYAIEIAIEKDVLKSIEAR